MREYEVKVIVTNTHYITVEAEDKYDARSQGEVYGYASGGEATSTSVEIDSVTTKKTKKYKKPLWLLILKQKIQKN